MKITGNLRALPKDERINVLRERTEFIMKRLVEGKTDQQIADMLGIDRSSIPRILRESDIRKDRFALNKKNATDLMTEQDAEKLFKAVNRAGFISPIEFLVDYWLTNR